MAGCGVAIGSASCFCLCTGDPQIGPDVSDDPTKEREEAEPQLARHKHGRKASFRDQESLGNWPAPASSTSRRNSLERRPSGLERRPSSSAPAAYAPCAVVAAGGLATAAGTGGSGGGPLLEETAVAERAFNTAVQEGRFIDAIKELHKLEAFAQEALDEASEERLEAFLESSDAELCRRLYLTYEYSIEKLNAKMADMLIHGTSANAHVNLEYALQIDVGILHIMYSVVYDDIDLVRAFAAMQERDLNTAFNRGLISCEALGDQTPNDTMWRAFTQSRTTGTLGDNVTITSSMDTLDEPVGCIWSATYTPPDAMREMVPPVREGHTRSERIFFVSKFEPLAKSGNRTKGLRMTATMEVILPSMVLRIIQYMPSFVLRRLVKQRMETMPRDFGAYCRASTSLDDRMRISPRAAFYDQLRCRLGGVGPGPWRSCKGAGDGAAAGPPSEEQPNIDGTASVGLFSW